MILKKNLQNLSTLWQQDQVQLHSLGLGRNKTDGLSVPVSTKLDIVRGKTSFSVLKSVSHQPCNFFVRTISLDKVIAYRSQANLQFIYRAFHISHMIAGQSLLHTFYKNPLRQGSLAKCIKLARPSQFRRQN